MLVDISRIATIRPAKKGAKPTRPHILDTQELIKMGVTQEQLDSSRAAMAKCLAEMRAEKAGKNL